MPGLTDAAAISSTSRASYGGGRGNIGKTRDEPSEKSANDYSRGVEAISSSISIDLRVQGTKKKKKSGWTHSTNFAHARDLLRV